MINMTSVIQTGGDFMLSSSTLKNYIGDVYLMETLKFNQEKAILDLKTTIQNLNNIMPLPEPVQAVEPSRKRNKALKEIALGVVINLLACVMLELVNDFFLQACLGLVIIGSLIAVIKGFCDAVGNVKIYMENKNIAKENQKNRDLYVASKKEYDKSVQKAQTAKRLAGVLQNRLHDLQSELSVIKNDLDHIYNYNIIYPAFRNRAAVTAFFEYLASGRCVSLEGHEGAYNLYSMESRMDHLADNQNIILSHLSRIEANQRSLVLAVNKSNQQIQQMQDAIGSVSSDLQRIANSSQVTNAHLERIAINTELIQFNSDQIRSEVELRNHVDGIFASHYL